MTTPSSYAYCYANDLINSIYKEWRACNFWNVQEQSRALHNLDSYLRAYPEVREKLKVELATIREEIDELLLNDIKIQEFMQAYMQAHPHAAIPHVTSGTRSNNQRNRRRYTIR